MSRNASAPWYHKGIRFTCQGCGRCCSQQGENFVYLTRQDIARAAALLGVEDEEFIATYCEKDDGVWVIRFTDGPCVFLEENRCAIYEARPVQCETWPFWPEHLMIPLWRSIVKPLCPGVGKGTLRSVEEIDCTARLAAASYLLQELEKAKSP